MVTGRRLEPLRNEVANVAIRKGQVEAEVVELAKNRLRKQEQADRTSEDLEQCVFLCA